MDNNAPKITIGDRLDWLRGDILRLCSDIKRVVRNHFKWIKTIAGLRSYNGYDGVLALAKKHLEDYRETEINMETDKKRLGELLNLHFFSWWD